MPRRQLKIWSQLISSYSELIYVTRETLTTRNIPGRVIIRTLVPVERALGRCQWASG
jgi:hypothetical protein